MYCRSCILCVVCACLLFLFCDIIAVISLVNANFHYCSQTSFLDRLCRPGSIVGPQQQYLASIEARMFREGAEYRLKHRLPAPAGDEVKLHFHCLYMCFKSGTKQMSGENYQLSSSLTGILVQGVAYILCFCSSFPGAQRSLASASGGSLDGVLSTYTGISVSGAASVGGLSTSLGTSAGTGQGHHHTGSNDTQRVMTPPLIGCRVKQQPAGKPTAVRVFVFVCPAAA